MFCRGRILFLEILSDGKRVEETFEMRISLGNSEYALVCQDLENAKYLPRIIKMVLNTQTEIMEASGESHRSN